MDSEHFYSVIKNVTVNIVWFDRKLFYALLLKMASQTSCKYHSSVYHEKTLNTP